MSIESEEILERTFIDDNFLRPLNAVKINNREKAEIETKQENEVMIPEEIVYYDEEDLLLTLAKDFSNTIKSRGEDYYYDGNVWNVYKNNNIYYAKVEGSEDNIYDVTIKILDEGHAEYKCSCPCDFPCKHEYAVLIAISNYDYSTVELKEFIKENNYELKKIIEEIPAEELKRYILSPKGLDNVIINENAFNENFRKYLPKQTYEYYYNNLYNDIMIEENYLKRVENYIIRSKQYLEGKEFNEVFKIIQATIEAYNDTDKINYDDYFFEMIGRMGIILRIAYRKVDDENKKELDKWLNKLVENNYYDNYYLEDLILGLK